MRLALMSDLHGNLEAFETCLQHARDRGVTHYAFLGDLVGYGGDPSAVLSRVMALAAEGALVLQGNHDAAMNEPTHPGNAELAHSLAWTRAQLDDAQRAYLAALPLRIDLGELVLVHASAWQPQAWEYVHDGVAAARCMQAAGRPWCFTGHVHEQRLWFQGAGRGCMSFDPTPGSAVPVPAHRQWVATVGSVGQPRDGDPAAAYAIFEPERRSVVFHRVAYDVAAASARIRAAGLPEFHARRLVTGS